MSEWKEVVLGDVADCVLGKMLDQKKNRGDLMPYLANVNIRWGRFELDDLRQMRFEPHEVERHGVKCGDIVMCEGGEPGRCAIWKNQMPQMMIQKAVHRIRPKSQIDHQFLYYTFLLKGQTSNFSPLFTGATIKHLTGKNLKLVKFPHPPLHEQKRIAGILSAYDDLIENNLRRIKILEDMAQSLYCEWFVHFRYPGHESTKLVDSPQGPIPQGWEVVPLSKIVDVTHGYAFKGKDFSKDPTSRVLTTPGNFKVGGGIKYDKLKYYGEKAEIKTGYVFEPMDLILTMTDLSKSGDTLGYPAFIPNLKGLTFLHNQRVGRVIPADNSFPKYFLYCMFCDDRYRHYIVGGATGLAVKHTSPTRILNYETPIPTTGSLIDDFDALTKPIFRRVNLLIESIENLRQTRDLLLPKLLTPPTD